jgi:DNA ligase (NAD+)
MPANCPACGSGVTKEGAYTLCPAGLSCPPQILGRIVHYGARDALDIAGLGRKTVDALIKKELVKNIGDLYDLTTEDIMTLDGFAERSAAQLYDAIHENKAPELDRFLYALGVRHVGQRVARILAEEYGSLKALEEAGEGELKEISEIGPEIAQSVVSFFGQEENSKVLKHLAEAGVRPKQKPPDKISQTLKGKTFVFTGKLENYTRQEAKRAVEERGGRATSSVSKETDYTVVGEDPGSKLDEAKEHKVKILDEKEFSVLLGGA